MQKWFFLLMAFCWTAQGKPFNNSYISFDIPETWACRAFGTDWVCHSKFQDKKVEAIITSTAKVAGPNDTLNEYKTYLQQEKTWSNIRKEQITSEKMTPAKVIFINRFQWVDSIHKNSEVKSYISRYVGTVCCQGKSSQLGILVVLSAHQDHYTKYSNIFIKTVNSLKVQDIDKAISKVRAHQGQAEGQMTDYLGGLFDDSDGEGLDDTNATDDKLFGLDIKQLGALAGVAVVFFMYFIIKKGSKKSRSRRRRRRRR